MNHHNAQTSRSLPMRQNRVAAAALDRIDRIKTEGGSDEYRSRCMDGPTLLARSGLAQGLGFLLAKANGGDAVAIGYKAYLGDLTHLLRAADPALPETPDDLFHQVAQAELADYQRLSRLALDASLWLKRIAQAQLAKPRDNGAR